MHTRGIHLVFGDIQLIFPSTYGNFSNNGAGVLFFEY